MEEAGVGLAWRRRLCRQLLLRCLERSLVLLDCCNKLALACCAHARATICLAHISASILITAITACMRCGTSLRLHRDVRSWAALDSGATSLRPTRQMAANTASWHSEAAARLQNQSREKHATSKGDSHSLNLQCATENTLFACARLLTYSPERTKARHAGLGPCTLVLLDGLQHLSLAGKLVEKNSPYTPVLRLN